MILLMLNKSMWTSSANYYQFVHSAVLMYKKILQCWLLMIEGNPFTCPFVKPRGITLDLSTVSLHFSVFFCQDLSFPQRQARPFLDAVFPSHPLHVSPSFSWYCSPQEGPCDIFSCCRSLRSLTKVRRSLWGLVWSCFGFPHVF